MSLKSIVNVVALSAIASTSLLPMATAAEARDGHRNAGQYQRHDGGNRHWKGNQRQQAYRTDGYRGYDRGHRRSHRGRNLAIGAFAAVLGLAIAAEASRSHGYDYDY